MKSTKKNTSEKYRIKVLQKAFSVLDLFSEDVPELSVPQMSERLGYNKTTCFRLVSNLEEQGFLDQDPETNRYRLGMRLFFLGNLVKPYRYLKDAAKPLLERLNDESGETVHLAVLHRGEALYLDKIESKRTVRVVVSQVGRKLPAHCSGVGKVLLAHLPAGQVKEIVAEKGLASFTEHTITEYEDLKSELMRVSQQGFACDNEEIEIGLKCTAAPVFFENTVIAALSVSVPRERFDANREELVRMVTQTALELTQVLNHDLREKMSSVNL